MGLERIRKWPFPEIKETPENREILEYLRLLHRELQEESILRVRDFEGLNKDTDLVIGKSKGVRARDDDKRIELNGSRTDAAGARVIAYGAGHSTLSGSLYLDYGDYTASVSSDARATIRLMDDGSISNVLYCDYLGRVGININDPPHLFSIKKTIASDNDPAMYLDVSTDPSVSTYCTYLKTIRSGSQSAAGPTHNLQLHTEDQSSSTDLDETSGMLSIYTYLLAKNTGGSSSHPDYWGFDHILKLDSSATCEPRMFQGGRIYLDIDVNYSVPGGGVIRGLEIIKDDAGGKRGEGIRIGGSSGWSKGVWVSAECDDHFVGGTADTYRGRISLHGHDTGSDLGGTVILHTAADWDGTYDYYFIDAYKDTLRISREAVGTDIVLTADGDVGFGTATPSVGLDAGTKSAQFKTVTFASEYDNGNSGASKTIDWGNGQQQKLTLTANCTLTFTAPDGPGTFSIRLIQDATGSRTVTWPATVKWPGGTAPTLSTAANAEDIIAFKYNGTNYYGDSALNFS